MAGLIWKRSQIFLSIYVTCQLSNSTMIDDVRDAIRLASTKVISEILS